VVSCQIMKLIVISFLQTRVSASELDPNALFSTLFSDAYMRSLIWDTKFYNHTKKCDKVILLFTFKMTYGKGKNVELNFCKYSLILMLLISISFYFFLFFFSKYLKYCRLFRECVSCSYFFFPCPEVEWRKTSL